MEPIPKSTVTHWLFMNYDDQYTLLSNDKISRLANTRSVSKAVGWMPAIHLGHTDNALQNFTTIQPLFDYIGPYPLVFVSLPLQAFIELACSFWFMQKTLCAMGIDPNWGLSEGRQLYRSEFGSTFLTPVSAYEQLHLFQTHTRHGTRMFDFGDKKMNLAAYGQEDTPRYNFSLINFDYLSMYVGSSDKLVTERDIQECHKELRVPHRIVTMRAKGVNHGAVFFHDEVASMVIIPTYKDIVSYGYRD